MTSRGSLLIVDDDTVLLGNLQEWFKAESYRVYGATNGIQALEILTENIVDILIADYIMPGINGLELIESALKIRPYLQAILFTGYADMDSAIQAVNLGARGYVQKAFSPATLPAENPISVYPKDRRTNITTLRSKIDELLARSLRHSIVHAMNTALRVWEKEAEKKNPHLSSYAFKADFAKASGLWAVQDEQGILRTRGLDRYLDIEKLPTRLNLNVVNRSLMYVLETCRSADPELLSGLLEKKEHIDRTLAKL